MHQERIRSEEVLYVDSIISYFAVMPQTPYVNTVQIVTFFVTALGAMAFAMRRLHIHAPALDVESDRVGARAREAHPAARRERDA